MNSLGYAKFRDGDYAGALAVYDEGVALTRQLPTSTGDSGEQRDLALVVASIGARGSIYGDNAGSLDAYKESLAVRRSSPPPTPAIPI